MSNYNTKFSFVIPAKDEQIDWILALAACVRTITNYWDADKKEMLKKFFDEETITIAGRIVDFDDHRDFHAEKALWGFWFMPETAPASTS